MVRKHRILLLCVTLGSAALGLGYGIYRGKSYTATGEIQIQPGAASGLKSASSLFDGGLSSLDDVMETDVAIIESPSLLMDVAKSLKLRENKDFIDPGSTVAGPNGTRIPLWHGDLDNPWVRQAILAQLKGGLAVARVPRTELISVSYKSVSPALAADIVDAVETTYIEENFKSHFEARNQVSKWLTTQIDDLRDAVQSSQDRVADLQKKLGINAFAPQHTLAVGELANLQKNISDATEARVLAEARYRILSSLPPDQIQDAPPTGNSSQDTNQSLLSSLRSQRAVAAASLAHLQPVYGPNYPQVKQLRSEIATIDKQISAQEVRVVKEAQDAYGVARNAEDQAKLQLASKEQELYGQRNDVVRYMLLNEEYESDRTMYQSILTRLREATVDAGLDAADISIVDLAALPITP